MTDDRIKSCPFCGSLDLNFVEGSTFRWIVAECQSCGARCGETRVKTLGDQDPDGDKAAALAEWNRRAIEAECRGVPDYVWMIGTKGFMALFATEEAANDWQHMNGTNTPASYIQPVSIPVISAAPKPDPERKHEIVPTIAAPVAQEPTAFLIEGFDGNGKRVAAVIQQNADNARNSASVFAEHYPSVKTSGLYLAPPDQSAEAQREINMALDLDDARERIAELEATIEAQRTLYANCIKISHEADELEHKCNRLERQQKVLVEALEKLARLGNGEHYGNSEGNCIAIAALASVKGNAPDQARPEAPKAL